MIHVIDVIRLGLEQLLWRNPEMFNGKIINNEELEHSLLHDLKNMVVDLQNLKDKCNTLEERTNILRLENDKLRLILEDLSFEQSKLIHLKTRRKS